MVHYRWLLLVGWATVMIAGCGSSGTTTEDPTRASNALGWMWSLPPNFPTPPVPADNPMSEAKFQLGRFLFYDKKLSGDGTFACANCHLQNLAFTDGKKVSVGATGQNTPRNAPSIVNSAYHATYTWARPDLTSLELQLDIANQAAGPLFGANPVEMGINSANTAAVLQRFQADANYQRLFLDAFPGEANPINFVNIIKAIATFERGVLSGGSKFDLYQRGQVTLTASEERGRILFSSEQAECFHCHGSFNFNDQVNYQGIRFIEKLFHNTGLYNIGDTSAGLFPAPNRGVFEQTGVAKDMGAFRAPSLLNIEVTGPYMHDGTIATLEGVLDFYASGGRYIPPADPVLGICCAGDGRNNPFKDPLIPAINLGVQDKADIVAFLKTLTDTTLLTNPRYANPFVP
ncbi:MAG: di-heme enzyme [Nitrosomonadales bacterium]|nr:di-heme enzyme [Nitrosomonadales bacterium]